VPDPFPTQPWVIGLAWRGNFPYFTPRGFAYLQDCGKLPGFFNSPKSNCASHRDGRRSGRPQLSKRGRRDCICAQLALLAQSLEYIQLLVGSPALRYNLIWRRLIDWTLSTRSQTRITPYLYARSQHPKR